MKFNSFYWNNFLDSSAGGASVAFFAGLKERYANPDPALTQFLQRWLDAGLTSWHGPDKLIADVHQAFSLLEQAESLESFPTASPNSVDTAWELFEAISGLWSAMRTRMS